MKRLELWEKYLPVGIDADRERLHVLAGLGLAFAWAVLSFGFRFAAAVQSLYIYNYGQRQPVLDITRRMTDFAVLFDKSLWGFGLLVLVMAYKGVQYYLYHRKESMSIYLMKRLPGRWELTRRCITVPIAAAAAALLLSVVCFWISFGVYHWLTPEPCLVAGQLQRFFGF